MESDILLHRSSNIITLIFLVNTSIIKNISIIYAFSIAWCEAPQI